MFGFKALRALRLEDLRLPGALLKTFTHTYDWTLKLHGTGTRTDLLDTKPVTAIHG